MGSASSLLTKKYCPSSRTYSPPLRPRRSPVVLRVVGDPSGAILEDHVEAALRSGYDPEIPVNLLDLGLVYGVSIEGSVVHVRMTLTAPGCGMGPVLVDDVKYRVGMVPGVSDVEVDLVFDPPWSREMMSEEAQLELGMFG